MRKNDSAECRKIRLKTQQVYMNKASEVCTIAVIIDKTYKHKCNCAHDSGYGLQPVPQNHAVPTCSHCGPIFFYTIGELQITVLYIP